MPPLFNDISLLLLDGSETSSSLAFYAQYHGGTLRKHSLTFRQTFKEDRIQTSEAPLTRIAPSSLVSCSLNSIHLSLLIPSLLPQFNESSIFAWSDLKAHFMCFPSPGDHSLVLLLIQYLKVVFSYI